MKAKEPKATVTVECLACKERREVEAGEIERGDYPMCGQCYTPMTVIKVTVR